MLGTQFVYAGDDGSRIVSWLREHLRAIATCLEGELPEAGLALIYSGIDTLGLLDAAPDVSDSSGETFKSWCEKYLLARLESIERKPLAAVDLWAARCGVLHTSTPVSKLSRKGEAHEVWYRFQTRIGVNLSLNTKLQPLGVQVENLALAFKQGAVAFVAELGADPARHQIADARAQCFLRWGIEAQGETAK